MTPHLADIKSVALFGSHFNGAPREDSEVDVLIDFVPTVVIGFFALSKIKDSFESFPKKQLTCLFQNQ